MIFGQLLHAHFQIKQRLCNLLDEDGGRSDPLGVTSLGGFSICPQT